jgi:hypothetical protein
MYSRILNIAMYIIARYSRIIYYLDNLLAIIIYIKIESPEQPWPVGLGSSLQGSCSRRFYLYIKDKD